MSDKSVSKFNQNIMKHALAANKSILKFLTAATGGKLQTATFMKLQNFKVMTGF